MNKLKFRAWHKELKLMRNVFAMKNIGDDTDLLIMTYGLNGLKAGSDNDELYMWSISEIELMQWTGLTDYKGNDIYLNDIVEFYIDNASDTMIAQVIWDEDRCCFGVDVDDPYLIGDLLEPFRYGNGIVMGNIYENPELLNV